MTRIYCRKNTPGSQLFKSSLAPKLSSNPVEGKTEGAKTHKLGKLPSGKEVFSRLATNALRIIKFLELYYNSYYV
ncbi:hypothetical protein VB713_07660 [Anabaena cylindrica UHCC 0172]|uniref:hypothetical protein n=1 Tax=Anabaena cylindrica TaxID=1165 RepID=UPI002B1EE91A|nr:hypothetical protein [Anabaena cylindrica]MEA5550850.1 hypothetical protein [Anabaena cylindrica UHCC 0172]